MTSRLVVLCACLQVLSIVASSGNVPRNNYSIEELRNVDASPEEKKELRTPLDDLKDEIERTIEESTNFQKKGRDQLEDSERPWFTKVPQLPLVYAMSSSLPDGPCKKQAQRYIRDLKNGTLWATEMYDASTKYPDGLISGHRTHFGHFDQCYNLEAKLTHYDDDDLAIDEEISGRYCLVDIKYEKQSLPPVNPNERHELVFDPNDSVWETIREKGNHLRKQRDAVRMALCVPAVCSHLDIEAALQEPLKRFGAEENLNLNISVKPHFCQARKDVPEFSQAAKIYCSIVAGLIALVIIGTWYDCSSKDDQENVGSTARGLMLCFSARRNINSLMAPTSGHRSFDAMHSVRLFLMIATIAGHQFVQYYAGVLNNPNYIERLFTYRWAMIIFAGTNIVEGFFGLSGLLVSYSLLGELDAKKKINFLGLIFIRFLRLTPSHMFVTFFCALILPHIGSGPLWEWRMSFERDSCANNWWTNLLYINNYVKSDQICLYQTWSLSVDYHLYIIALVATYLFWRMPRKHGYLFLCPIILSGFIAPFINSYVYGVQPILLATLTKEELRDCTYFTGHYVKTHERITSYFIGVLVGAVLYDHSRAPWQLGKVSSNILFILVTILAFGSQLLGYKYYDLNANPTRLELALYACLHKPAFAIFICAIPFLVTVGTGMNFLYNFFTPRWCQPLARLTYGVYLIHIVIQVYNAAVTRAPTTFAVYKLLWNCVPEAFYAFGASFLLNLIVEAPFRQIEKRFITKRKSGDQSNRVKKEAKKTN